VTSTSVVDPGAVEVTMKITMRVRDWARVDEALRAAEESYRWPFSDFCEAIRDQVERTGRVYNFATGEEPS
jgi:hypothetical protein